MARDKNNEHGFSPEKIVKMEDEPSIETPTTPNSALEDLVSTNTPERTANEILKNKKEKPEKVEQINVRLKHSVARKLKNYGKQIGIRNRGASVLVENALLEYFEKHDL